jgi:hypothetical protein
MKKYTIFSDVQFIEFIVIALGIISITIALILKP